MEIYKSVSKQAIRRGYGLRGPSPRPVRRKLHGSGDAEIEKILVRKRFRRRIQKLTKSDRERGSSQPAYRLSGTFPRERLAVQHRKQAPDRIGNASGGDASQSCSEPHFCVPTRTSPEEEHVVRSRGAATLPATGNGPGNSLEPDVCNHVPPASVGAAGYPHADRPQEWAGGFRKGRELLLEEEGK